jgi:hypothetical protein
MNLQVFPHRKNKMPRTSLAGKIVMAGGSKKPDEHLQTLQGQKDSLYYNPSLTVE